jgi:hypothetical protein
MVFVPPFVVLDKLLNVTWGRYFLRGSTLQYKKWLGINWPENFSNSVSNVIQTCEIGADGYANPVTDVQHRAFAWGIFLNTYVKGHIHNVP